MKKKLLLVIVLAVALMSGVANAVIYNASTDWETALGPIVAGTSAATTTSWGQWSVGYGTTMSDLIASPKITGNATGEAGFQFFNNGSPGAGNPLIGHQYTGTAASDYALPGELAFSPYINWSYTGKLAKLRWTSNINGTATIDLIWAKGWFTASSGTPSASAEAYVVKNGVALSTTNILTDLTETGIGDKWGTIMPQRTIHLVVPVAIGDTIDFAVNVVNGEANANMRARNLTITTAPSSATATNLSVDLHNVTGPVNRRVMGVCMVYAPFDTQVANAFAGVLDGTSARAWANWGGIDPTEAWWAQFMPFTKSVGIDQINAMNTNSQMSVTASYISASNNNLAAYQLPSAIANSYVGWINKRAHTSAYPGGYGIKMWETWGEPYSPSTGAWPSADMVRYVLDCSTQIRQVDPTVGIGVALDDRIWDPYKTIRTTWNTNVLQGIANADVNAVDFAIIHPYAVLGLWSTDSDRVAVAELMRIASIRPTAQLVASKGQGRWKIAASEWNIHGTYDPPYNITTDMAAAIHVAGMFDVFWGEGIYSAQFFQLLNTTPYHFGMALETAGTLTLYPTAEVFRLYGRYFRGDRINTSNDTSTYTYSVTGYPSVQVPYLISHTAYDAVNKRLVVILTNRKPSGNTSVNIHVANFIPKEDKITTIAVTASTLASQTPIVTTNVTNPGLTPDPYFSVQAPPSSVMAVIIEGNAVPADCNQVKHWGYGLTGDLNGDCKVKFDDFAILASRWLQ